MIDFGALEQAFAPIQDVGRQEIPFEVEGQLVVLGPLLPSEETGAQGYARSWVDERADTQGEVPKHIATEYMNVLRTEILCYAIVEVNGLDLRGVDYVATGQKTDRGHPVRVQRHVAVRGLITKTKPWSRTMLEVAFGKYGELQERIETASADLVRYEPADLTSEMDRAKSRVADLEKEMERRAKGDPNLFSDQVKAIAEYDKANQDARQASRRPSTPEGEPAPQAARAHATPPAPEVTPLEPESAPVPPEPVAHEPATNAPVAEPEPEWAEFEEMPTAADLRDDQPPPEPVGPVTSLREQPREPVTPPTSSPPTGPPAAPPTPPAAPPTPPASSLDGVMDSFGDPEDPAVMAGEEQRILAARRAMAARREEGRQGAAPVRRAPPHSRGVREDAVSLEATQVGHVGDAPAFRLPTEELSVRGRGRGRAVPEDASAPSSESKSRNPHFVPAKR